MTDSPKSRAPWGGRFKKETDPVVRRYTRSLHLDRRLAGYDLRGSRAHVRMLARQEILTSEDRDAILSGLDRIEAEIRSGTFPYREDLEDIHMNIEHRLQEIVGEAGKRVHTARSRNDQVVLDMKLFVLDSARHWQGLLRELQGVLVERAGKLRDGVFPAWTHLQTAQPLPWAHYLLAFCEMFERDHRRLDGYLELHSVSPLGAGALSGSTFPIDPRRTADELGFRDTFRNSYDVVGDRDFLLELLQIGTQIMLHVSRLAEDFIYFSSTPVEWIELPDELCTGSSMMPQKKNPDLLELARGKAATVIGHVTSLATLLKGLPSSYHRDLQQDKEHLFPVVDIVEESLEILRTLVFRFRVREERVEEALRRGFLMATDLAEHLVKKGVPFRAAHERVGRLVSLCVERGLSLDEVSPEELAEILPECGPEVGSILRVESASASRRHAGSSGASSIASQLEFWGRRLGSEGDREAKPRADSRSHGRKDS